MLPKHMIGHICIYLEESSINSNIMSLSISWYTYESQKSRLWSRRKRKWFEGPQIPTGLKFTGASGVKLNHTSILFIGLSKMPFLATQNNITIIYDFESKLWTLQESIALPECHQHCFQEDFIFQTSCSIIESKHEKR